MNKYSVHIEKLTIRLADELCDFCIFSETHNPSKENAKLLWDEMHLVFDEQSDINTAGKLRYEYDREIIYRCAQLLPRDQKGPFGDRVSNFHSQIALLKFLIEERGLQKGKQLIKSEVDSFVYVEDPITLSPEPVNELGLFYRLFHKESNAPLKRNGGKQRTGRR